MKIIDKLTTVTTNEKGLILAYSGYFFIDFLTIFGRKIKQLTKTDYFASVKLFKVFMELGQNISLYSEQRVMLNDNSSVGFGTFTLDESGDYYNVSASNFVNNEDALILQERCEKINSMTKKELRALKREQRRQANGYKIGARVGLIQIAILSGNKLIVEILPKSEELSQFTISTSISKF